MASNTSVAPALKCSYFKLQTVITRMRGKAQRDGRPAVKGWKLLLGT